MIDGNGLGSWVWTGRGNLRLTMPGEKSKREVEQQIADYLKERLEILGLTELFSPEGQPLDLSIAVKLVPSGAGIAPVTTG